VLWTGDICPDNISPEDAMVSLCEMLSTEANAYAAWRDSISESFIDALGTLGAGDAPSASVREASVIAACSFLDGLIKRYIGA
jgi:hypothetical protein